MRIVYSYVVAIVTILYFTGCFTCSDDRFEPLLDEIHKKYRQEYKDDKPNGRWIFWSRAGKVVIEEIYNNGKLVKKRLLN